MTPPPVAPFRGLRYNPAHVTGLAAVMAPPYDVIDADLQERLYRRDPHNIIRLILGKQSAADPEGDNRYTRAAADFQRWQQEAVLEREAKPSLYVYHQTFELEGGRRLVRKGFIGLKRLEAFGAGGIHPHEKTLEGPKADRLKLTRACRANFSPIFGLHPELPREAQAVLEKTAQGAPDLEVADDDGVIHQLWVLDDPQAIATLCGAAGRQPIFIADGHHRYETALNYLREREQEEPSLPETSPLRFVLMFFCSLRDPGLVVLPTHRVVKGMKSFTPAACLSGLREFFEVESFREEHRAQFLEALRRPDPGQHALGLMLHGDHKLHLLTLNDQQLDRLPALQELPPPLRQLDAAVLHHLMLGKLLGLSEAQQRDPAFVRFIKAESDVWEEMLSSDTHCAILLNPPTMAQIEAVARAGLIMPPKTTYFYPKLLSGLVINPLW